MPTEPERNVEHYTFRINFQISVERGKYFWLTPCLNSLSSLFSKQVRTTEGKGRGVFTTRAFKRSEFVCEYTGELISYNVAKKREKQYEEDTNIGCYMYYLSCNNKKYW